MMKQCCQNWVESLLKEHSFFSGVSILEEDFFLPSVGPSLCVGLANI